jgi:tetratricopeptide (TPR) repeat protein
MVALARNWIYSGNSKGAASTVSRAKDASDIEVRTRLDEPGGYASYHRDDAWHDRVAAQFEESLRAIVSACRAAKVPLLLVKPGSNVRDCPPYKSEHRPGLSLEEERTWQTLFDKAGAAEQERPEQALASCKKAEQIDPDYALLLFRIARLLDTKGETQPALEYYLKARDRDICPLRPTTRLEQILSGVSQETKTPLLDATALIAEQSMNKIPGNDWYLDHVHPNIGGHQQIARALVAQIRQLGLVPAPSEWPEAQRRQAYASHLEKLGQSYLTEGLRRVEWLEHWARRERLLDETSPRDAAGFLRAAFRHLELGDEEAASKEITEAVNRDRNLEQAAQGHAERLLAEGRKDAAQHLTESLR